MRWSSQLNIITKGLLQHRQEAFYYYLIIYFPYYFYIRSFPAYQPGGQTNHITVICIPLIAVYKIN